MRYNGSIGVRGTGSRAKRMILYILFCMAQALTYMQAANLERLNALFKNLDAIKMLNKHIILYNIIITLNKIVSLSSHHLD